MLVARHLAFITIVMAAAPGLSFAQQTLAQRLASSLPQSVTGKVHYIDATRLEIVTEAPLTLRFSTGKTMNVERNGVLVFTPKNSRIQRGIFPIALSDIKVGSVVGVTFADPYDIGNPIQASVVYLYHTPPPGQSQTVTPKQIQWNPALSRAFDQAVAQKKPLIVYFKELNCGWCQRMENETFKSEQINTLASQAVFAAIVSSEDDSQKNVSRMVDSLGIDRLPTTAVLDVSPTAIAERGRIVGYFEPQAFYYKLTQILLKPSALP